MRSQRYSLDVAAVVADIAVAPLSAVYLAVYVFHTCVVAVQVVFVSLQLRFVADLKRCDGKDLLYQWPCPKIPYDAK